MRKKIVLMILMIVLLSSICFAKEVFEGTIKEETEKDIGGRTIILRYYESNDKVSMNIVEEEKYVLVDKGSCETSGLFRYCFDAVEDKEEEVNISGKTLLKTFFYMDMIVYKQAPDIAIDISLNKEEASIDERFDMNIKLTNSGDLDSSSANFEMTIPDNIEVVSTTASVHGSKILFSSLVQKGQTVERKVTMKAMDYGEFEFEGTVEYASAGTTETEEESAEIDVPFPYDVTTDLSLELAALNEESEYTLKINNTDVGEILNINSIEIEFPTGVTVKSVPFGFIDKGNRLEGSDQISPGDEKEYAFKFKSAKMGDYTITTTLDLRTGQKTFQETITNNFGVGMSGVIPRINISNEFPKSYDSITFKVYLYNRDTKNITTAPVVTSNLFDRAVVDETLYEPGEVLVLEKTVTAPSTEESLSSYVEVNGEYTSSTGKDVDYSARTEFSIEAEEKVVKVTQDAVAEDFVAEVSVSIENLKASKLENVEIFDMLPKGFKVVGDQMKTVSLDAFEKQEVLAYTVGIPEDYSEDNFLIDHTVNVEDSEGEFFIQEISLRVDLEKVQQETASDVIHNVTEEPKKIKDVEEEEEEKEPGAFGKIWNGIKGVVGGFFGFFLGE
ncbi:hypothetical protein ACFL96_09185 [Thermoproteota archaeon]